jgi:hypothetical protein
VAVVYFGASAFVKLVVEESGSDIAAALWDGCDAAVSSRLAYPEVCAALTAAGRSRDLESDALAACRQHWDELWSAVRPVEFTSRVEQIAGRLTRSHNLRGADAVHLASALEVSAAGLVVAVWDRRFHLGAVAEGLAVAPATLP